MCGVLRTIVQFSSCFGIDRGDAADWWPDRLQTDAGQNVRLLVEAKKLHNGDFWIGLESQLPSYVAAAVIYGI